MRDHVRVVRLWSFAMWVTHELHTGRYTRGLAWVAESVDAADLKFASHKLYGFESRPRHHAA